MHIPAQYVLNENPFTARFYTELRSRGERRDAQFGGLLADLGANPSAALVSGDFNSTGAMGELRPLFDRLTSANTANRSIYPTSWYAVCSRCGSSTDHAGGGRPHERTSGSTRPLRPPRPVADDQSRGDSLSRTGVS